jgi:hypothetical protein
MRIDRAATSIVLRVALLWFVAASVNSSGTVQEAGGAADEGSRGAAGAPSGSPSFSRALAGFTASLALTVLVMIMAGAHAFAPPPERIKVALRGSIH